MKPAVDLQWPRALTPPPRLALCPCPGVTVAEHTMAGIRRYCTRCGTSEFLTHEVIKHTA